MLNRWASPPVPAGLHLHAHANAATVPASSASSTTSIDPSVFNDFRGLGVGGHDFLNNLIDQFVTEATSRITDLRDADQRHDAPALRRNAHRLN